MENIKHMTTHQFKHFYGTETACLKALLDFRTGVGGLCFNSACGATIDKYYHKLKGRKAFICGSCLRHYYPMAGCFLQKTHIPVVDWFQIIFKLLYSKNGVAAKELHREYGYSYRCIFRMLHEVREHMMECLQFDLSNSVVEVDESFMKTGKKGFGKHYPFKKGRGSLQCTTILGIVERKGVVKFYVLPDASSDSIIPIILRDIPTSTVIHTDSWPAYKQLGKLGYVHTVVNHSKFEFVNYETGGSTNSAEGAFSNLKRISSTLRNVSQGKLQNYLNESAFRHSYRFEQDYGFTALLQRLPPLSEIYTKEKFAA